MSRIDPWPAVQVREILGARMFEKHRANAQDFSAG